MIVVRNVFRLKFGQAKPSKRTLFSASGPASLRIMSLTEPRDSQDSPTFVPLPPHSFERRTLYRLLAQHCHSILLWASGTICVCA